MSTDLKKRVPPKTNSSAAKTELAEALESGIGDVSVRELLGMLISSVGASERKAYLSRVSEDKANGFYDRNLQVGTIPVDIEVARTRSGRFRPAVLPAAYQRGYNDETQSILLGLLASGRSVNAVKELFNRTLPSEQTGLGFKANVIATLKAVSAAFNHTYTDQQASDLADVLIPDLLTYKVGDTIGFLNGRRLTDDVIDTLLAVGANTPGASDCIGNDSTFTGTFPFEVRTSLENQSLGCSSTTPCTLEAVPIDGINCEAVTGIQDFSFKQKAEEKDGVEQRINEKAPANLEMPDLAITLPEAKATA